MEDSEQEEQQQEEEGSEEFNVIPPYSEKDSNIESGARGSKRGAASRAVPVLPLLLLLPTLIVDWECWSFWSLHLIPRSYFTQIHHRAQNEPRRTIARKNRSVSLSLVVLTLFHYFGSCYHCLLKSQRYQTVVPQYLPCLCPHKTQRTTRADI